MKLNMALKFFLVVVGVVLGFGSYGVAGDWVTTGSNIYFEGGKVGIGTNAPKNKLHVRGEGADGYLVRFSSGSNLGTRILFENDYSDALKGFSINTGGEANTRKNTFNFYTMPDSTGNLGKQIMTFDSYGRVGIGTVYPGHRLTVQSSGPDTVAIAAKGTKGLLGFFYEGPDNQGRLYLRDDTNTNKIKIDASGDTWFKGGNVGIGTSAIGSYKLNVAGKIRANEIVVNTTGADYVFEENYKLKPLREVESFIEKEKHLPDIPSAAEMQTEGVGISDMQTKLLAKVEELTLYLIEQNKNMTIQNKKIEQLIAENETLKKKVAALEQ